MSKARLVGTLKALADEIPNYLCRSLHGAVSERCRSRLENFVSYTTEGGRMVRSLLTCEAYSALRPTASEGELHTVSRVAATVELLQTFILVLDDIMDDAETRRGTKCWWRQPEVGLSAINDALLMDNSIDWVLREAMQNHSKLNAVLLEFYETRQSLHRGQLLDCLPRKKLEDFTWERYYQTVENKSSRYSFYLPLALGWHLADLPFDEHKMWKIANKLGLLFQAENDVVDCYPAEGERSDDLAEGKCSWATIRVLEKLASDQRQQAAFLNHLLRGHGHSDEEKEHMRATLVTVHELDIRGDYERFRGDTVREIHADVEAWSDLPPKVKKILYALLEMSKKYAKQAAGATSS